MYYNKFVKSILLAIWVPFLSLIAAIVIIDPLQVFHKSWIHPGRYVKSFREALYGIVKYEDYDSVIVGSSMATNFSANEASKKLGGKFINIALKGFTSPKEKLILLDHLFKEKSIKKIIYSYDGYIEGDFINHYDRLFGSFFEKMMFYFNDNLLFFLRSSINYNEHCISDLDSPDAWHKIAEHKDRFGGFDKWMKFAIWHPQAKASIEYIVKAVLGSPPINKRKKYTQHEIYSGLERNLFRFVKEHKNTFFFVFLPPVSKIYQKATKILDENVAKEYFFVVRCLVNVSMQFNNLIIYGFDNEPFTSDVKRYKDLGHYDEKVNSFIIDAIKNKTHILTAENVDSYLEKFEKGVLEYDIKSLYEQIKKEGIMLE